ncbi:sugar ABC transporter permease [Streptomyces sp. NA04227]|uniref:sugar ABC transporter permease n=1 Tax=Streptomyces sp. NA04227 TaxID=2742136 RepID=UPI001591F2D9|nr:sugar ABC transporter permease [Streptomyces sp. NA04227]QKW08088.1 sugar ABC transporter permease [Streptomyces sp. NA04227]
MAADVDPLPRWVARALDAVLDRVAATRAQVGDRFPLFADPVDGRWKTTGRGSWTGGFWAGLLWLRARHTGNGADHAAAVRCTGRLAHWVHADTATRGLIFWYGTLFADTSESAALRARAAQACRASYDADLELVPWGGEFGGPRLMARVDGVPGMVPLLATTDARAAESHLRRHVELTQDQRALHWSHRWESGSWSPCAEPPPGWSRGPAWLLLAASEGVRHLGSHTVDLNRLDLCRLGIPDLGAPGLGTDTAQLAYTAGELQDPAPSSPSPSPSPSSPMAHIPLADKAHPTGPLDTSAAAITATALLGLGHRDHALAFLHELVHAHLQDDGRLLNGCYDHASGTATQHELIWGDFFLAYALALLTGLVGPGEG